MKNSVCCILSDRRSSAFAFSSAARFYGALRFSFFTGRDFPASIRVNCP